MCKFTSIINLDGLKSMFVKFFQKSIYLSIVNIGELISGYYCRYDYNDEHKACHHSILLSVYKMFFLSASRYLVDRLLS